VIWIIPHGFRTNSPASHSYRAAALLLCLGLAAPLAPAAHAQAVTAAAGESAPLPFRVEIEAPIELRNLLQKGLDLMRWQHNERVRAESLKRLVAEARVEAERAMAAEGYFSATVKTSIEQEDKNALVRISVEPGPRTTVSAVDIRFRGPIAAGDAANSKRIDAARRAWRLRPGEPFRQVDWDAAKRAVVEDVARELYAATSLVKSEARVDPETRTAALHLELDSGPPFRFGALEVSGTRRYQAAIVEHLYPIKPGEPYEASRLAAFQRRLLETGYFATAQIAIDRDTAKADAAPVQVSVIEARSQRIDTGIYASTDTALGVQFDYTNQDLLDRALRFRTRAKWDSKTQLLDTAVDTPPREGGVWNTLSARYEGTDIQNQRTDGTMVGISYNWGIESTPSQLALSAHHERQVIIGSNTERNDAVYAGYRQIFRYTDDPLLPRRGVLGSVHVGSSLPSMATQDFARVTGKVNALIPLGRRFDFSARAEGGIVFANSRFGIPSTFLFRTGGDQTVRGYSYQSIGVPQGAAIVGGRYLAIASAEATWWLAGDLGAAIFVDAGDAFDDRDEFDPAFGYGVGVRWRSPIGPFRADVAYGVRSSSLRLHFSVGFSF
jgi:translocation and assembly module TamA